MFGPVNILGELVPGKNLTGRTNGAVPFDELIAGTEKYQWLRNGVPLEGETKKNYTVKREDVEQGITFRYTFKTATGEHSVDSKPEIVDMGFWRNLYWTVLGREPDPEGLAFWRRVVTTLFKGGIK